MGHIVHTAVVFTGSHNGVIYAHCVAKDLGLSVTDPVYPAINEYYSICVLPHGSKSGWDTANEKNEARQRLLEICTEERKKRNDAWDHHFSLEWVEVAFGGDSEKPVILSYK